MFIKEADAYADTHLEGRTLGSGRQSVLAPHRGILPGRWSMCRMLSVPHITNRIRRRGAHVLAAGGIYALYALVFVLSYDRLGPGVGALSVVPVMGASWLVGPRAWLLAGAAGVALNGWLYSICDPSGWLAVTHWWLGHLLVVFLGYIAAVLASALGAVREQARQLAREREALKQQVAETERTKEQLREVVRNAPCLLWHASVRQKEDGTGYHWDIQVYDEDAAQAFLPLEVPPGGSYPDAWWFAKLPEDRRRSDQVGTEALATGKDGYSQEFRCVDATGRERWLSESVRITHVSPGEWRLIGICTDVTDRKQAEQRTQLLNQQLEQRVAERTAQLQTAVAKLQAEISQRRQAEQELRRVLDSARCHLWHATVTEWRSHGQLDYLWELRSSNPEAAQRFLPIEVGPGQSYEEAFRNTIPREDREDMDRRSHHALAAGLPGYSQQFRCRRADGQIRWLYEDVHIERTAPGVWHLVGVRTDITEQRQTEEELSRLTLALLHSADAVLVADADCTVQYVNPAFERIVGWTKEEVVGQHMSILKDAVPDWSSVAEEASSALRNGQVWARSGPQRRRDGSTYYADATVSPILDEDGRVTAYVAVIRDITERMNLEEQLRQSQRMEAIGRLAGGVAHDFNNLLTAISGYGNLLLSRLDPSSSLHGYADQILRAAERAALLTRQLLAFSRKQVLEPKLINLNTVVSEMQPMLQRLLGEDIRLAASLAPDLLPVKADPGQIEQVIMNLAVNARDAMPDGGSLTIETANVYLDEAYTRRHAGSQPGQHVMLAVADTGCGISQEVLPHIFEPFFTTKEKGKGTGLGLSTVYGIVKQSGGNIWVYSEVGKGTTFKVYLPAVAGAEEETPDGALDASEEAPGNETVLVVEDEDSVRSLAQQVLEAHGYTVLTAQSGDDALRVAKEYTGTIHLLLTDVVMPGISGRELADRLCEERPALQALFMSGYTDNAIVHHGVLDPGIAYIQKPFTPRALAAKVRGVLDRSMNQASPQA